MNAENTSTSESSASEKMRLPSEIQKITAHTAMEIVQHFDLQEKSVPLLNFRTNPR